MSKIKVFASYGVLAHEKKPFYSVGAPAGDIYDEITVKIPYPTWSNPMGDLGVTIDGVDYLMSQVLTNHGDEPALTWFDGRRKHRVILETVQNG